jgi:small subunit ribosomal protein S20
LPVIKSARKRVKVAEKATIRNVKTKRQYKSSIKLHSKKPTISSLREVQSAIDKATKKHVIHKNKAARLKRRAASLAKSEGVKLVKKTAPAAKPKTAKKPTAAKTKAAPKKK